MSAWIEINPKPSVMATLQVALYMSAWIEIGTGVYTGSFGNVALYMSAWIEMSILSTISFLYFCRTLHECVD